MIGKEDGGGIERWLRVKGKERGILDRGVAIVRIGRDRERRGRERKERAREKREEIRGI